MIAMSSLIFAIFVWLITFNVNAITAPKEIVEIKNRIDETLSDDLKIKRNLFSNFSLQLAAQNRNPVIIINKRSWAQYAKFIQIYGRVPKSPDNTNKLPISVIALATFDL